jgi:alkaline phosphatase D
VNRIARLTIPSPVQNYNSNLRPTANFKQTSKAQRPTAMAEGSLSLPHSPETSIPEDGTFRFPAKNDYQKVENSAWHGGRTVSAVTWSRVLAVLVVALVINVVILTANLVQDEKQIAWGWAPLPPSDAAITSLAFGSCSSQLVPQPYWDTLLEFGPDLVVLMGDNVYGDCNEMTCSSLHQAYNDWESHPSFQGAKSILPVVATLDDHDYGKPDCHADNPYKDVAKEMFVDFFDIPDRNHKDGVYGAYEWGPIGQRVQLIVLDTRYARSAFLATDEPMAPGKEVYIPDTVNRDKQMLSSDQWAWLGEQVKRPTNVRLVVSSIQVLAEGNGFEGWRMLPFERTRLVNLLQNETTTTVLLTGDRHVGGFYHYNNLIEVTASSWTHSIPFGAFNNCSSAQTCDEFDERRIGDFVRVNNFGSIEWDWENSAMTVSLRRAETSQQSLYINGSHKEGDAGEPIQSYTYPVT